MTKDEENDLFASAEQAIAFDHRIEQTISRIQKVLFEFGLELEVLTVIKPDLMEKEEFLDFERRCSEAAILNQKVYFLAGHIFVALLVKEDAEGSDKSLDDFCRIRMSIIGDLWLNGLWVEPWISIMRQELPGPDPNSKDFENFIESAADRAIQSVENKAMFNERRTAILEILREGDYPLEPLDRHASDYHLVTILAIHTRQNSIRDVRKNFEARQFISQIATDPDHPAWQVVIETYLTD